MRKASAFLLALWFGTGLMIGAYSVYYVRQTCMDIVTADRWYCEVTRLERQSWPSTS